LGGFFWAGFLLPTLVGRFQNTYRRYVSNEAHRLEKFQVKGSKSVTESKEKIVDPNPKKIISDPQHCPSLPDRRRILRSTVWNTCAHLLRAWAITACTLHREELYGAPTTCRVPVPYLCCYRLTGKELYGALLIIPVRSFYVGRHRLHREELCGALFAAVALLALRARPAVLCCHVRLTAYRQRKLFSAKSTIVLQNTQYGS
jgi:hypothetical protein